MVELQCSEFSHDSSNMLVIEFFFSCEKEKNTKKCVMKEMVLILIDLLIDYERWIIFKEQHLAAFSINDILPVASANLLAVCLFFFTDWQSDREFKHPCRWRRSGKDSSICVTSARGDSWVRLSFPATLIWPQQSSCLVLKVSRCYKAPWHYLGATDEEYAD